MLLSVALSLTGCQSDSKIERVNHPPTVEIAAPSEGELFRQGVALIGLRAEVHDDADPPPHLSITWTVDGGAPTETTASEDGTVGLDVDPTLLDLGEHLALITVVDTDGDASSAQVTFEVGGPVGAPTVAITAPNDGDTYPVGTTITFLGEASDTTTPADDLVFAWSSSLDGALTGAITGDGQSALLTDGLSIGTHYVTLTVTDGDGEVGSDAVQVVVEDDVVVEPEPGDLIFSELMVNPNAAADEDGEWVELYNTSGSTLDIAGYSFHDDDSDEWVFDASILVEPHSYIVLCANPDRSINGGVPCDGWFYRNPMGEQPSAGLGHGSGVAIANNDDELVLTSPTGVDIDVFDYNDTDSDPIETGMSFGLDPTKLTGTANDIVGNWCVQSTILDGLTDPGTPGVENDPC